MSRIKYKNVAKKRAHLESARVRVGVLAGPEAVQQLGVANAQLSAHLSQALGA